MNKTEIGIGFALFAASTSSWATYAATAKLDAKTIMTRNEEARKLSDVISNATLTTGATGSSAKLKKFTWWRKLTGDSVHYYTLTKFSVPAEIRGEGILFQERDQGDSDVMMYLPNFKKVRRVETQAQSGSFMGSEFSYSDISTPHVDDYTYELVKEEPCASPGESPVACFVVQAVPANQTVKDRTGYSRTLNWIRQDNFMSVKGEFYDASGTLFKKMEASEIKKVDAAKSKWLAHRVKIENTKSGRFTVLEFENPKVNSGIPDTIFTQQNLSKE